MNLIFVESPLQILNAYEAIDYYSLDNYQIIVRLSNIKVNDEQIKYVIKKLNMCNIQYITIKVYNKNIFDYCKLAFYRIKYIFSKVNKVFIGNYESRFFKLILKQFNKNQIILMDDGAKTINIQNKFNNSLYYNLFTMYNLKPYKGQFIVKNKYLKIQNKLQNLKVNKNQILFIGLKLSELNIITEKYYIELLKKISILYKNKEIIYISHRGENKRKLEYIQNTLNFKIKNLNYPIEMYGLYNKSIPYKVMSFYSTALLTMKNIYQLEVQSFKFNYNDTKYKSIIDDVYNYYSKYINIIDL